MLGRPGFRKEARIFFARRQIRNSPLESAGF
jgi:hypothetical protein